MKKTTMFLASLAVAGMAACTHAPVASPFVHGIVLDASMNDVMILTDNGDTLTLSTMDVSPEKAPGVFIDDSVMVKYIDVDRSGVMVPTVDSMVVTAQSPYVLIQGSWVMPNPIDAAQVQGFTLNQDGTAASINMATLEFLKWNMANGELELTTKSIGNKVVIEGTDTLKISKLTPDSLVLTKGDLVVWSLARQK